MRVVVWTRKAFIALKIGEVEGGGALRQRGVGVGVFGEAGADAFEAVGDVGPRGVRDVGEGGGVRKEAGDAAVELVLLVAVGGLKEGADALARKVDGAVGLERREAGGVGGRWKAATVEAIVSLGHVVPAGGDKEVALLMLGGHFAGGATNLLVYIRNFLTIRSKCDLFWW